MTEDEEREALRLCIRDARHQRLGVKASTSQWAGLLVQLDRDMGEAQRLAVVKYSEKRSVRPSYPYGVDVYTFTHSHVEILTRHGTNVADIYVAGEEAYRKGGLGRPGAHSTLSIGDSLLPGVWWADIAKAAAALRAAVAKRAQEEQAALHEREDKLAAAHALLASRCL